MGDIAPFAVLGALVSGIAAGERLGPGPGPVALVACAALMAVACPRHVPRARRALALVAVALLGIALTQRALNGLEHWPLAAAVAKRADATVTASLVDDPDGNRFTTSVLARLGRAKLDADGWRDAGGRTVLVVAEGEAAPRLRLLDAGDRVVLRGWLRPLEGYDAHLRWRHAVARFDANTLVDFTGPRRLELQVANSLRGVVLRGTAALAPTERGLVAGFLLGDTRGLPDYVVEQFRASGLTHLLAVSGENVAFVLALVGPLLRRLSRSARLVGTLGVLGVFGAMTRWEPSVLRACAMAACVVLALHLGRPTHSTRVLALAVTGLLVVDPFLLHSIGFQLSCGACLGIALFGPRLAAALGGPAWFRESLAVTAGAQLGVAPVLLSVFGSMPLVTLPANLLAVPIAGPLTIWGLGAGGATGLLGRSVPGVAALLQAPTRVLADAVLGIADAASRVPVALDAPTALTLCAVIGIAVLARRGRMLRRHALVVPPR